MIDILHQKPLLGRQINWAHPLAKGLVGSWVMNEGSGNKVFDLSGNRNEGTLQNMAENDWVPGESGHALDFDGSDDDGDLSNPPSLTNIFDDGGSIVCNVYIHSLGGSDAGRIISAQDGGGAGWLLFTGDVAGPDFIILEQVFSGGSGVWISSIFPFNTWRQIIVTYNNSSVTINPKIYYSGISQTVVENTTPIGIRVDDTNITKHIGNIGQQSRGYDGLIEYIHIYDHILLQDEATRIYQEPFAMFQQNRVRWFSIAAPPVGDGQAFRLRAIEKY